MIILVLLAAFFYWGQKALEDRFFNVIEQDLLQTKRIVHDLMQQRLERFIQYSNVLENNNLLRELITDKTFDRLTRDDILEEEILPGFEELSVLILVQPDGNILANNQLIQEHIAHIKQTNFFADALKGELSQGYFFVGNQCIQIIGKPIYILEEMTAVIFLGTRLTRRDAKKVHSLSGAELAFWNQQNVFLSTKWGQTKHSFKAFISQLESNAEQLKSMSSSKITIDDERFVYTMDTSNDHFVPPYIVAKSLDKQLIFVNKMKQDGLLAGLFAILIGTILSLIFSRSISKPIQILQEATQEIERENYQHRLHINSKDEFTDLAKLFNHMLIGLEEKESLRAAMNRSVSKEITEQIMKSQLNVTGEYLEVSLIYTKFHGLTQRSTELSAEKLLAVMNNYFTRLSFCVDAHNGVIDKYINDSMLVFFGAPIQSQSHAIDALSAAQSMLDAAKQFNQEAELEFQIPLTIAVHSGNVLTGNIGAENRNNYSMIGSIVDDLFQFNDEINLDQSICIFTEELLSNAKQQSENNSLPAHQFIKTVDTGDINLYQLR
jgi:class 3 adenylate cyclase